MVQQVAIETNNFTDPTGIDEQKLEVRTLLEREHIHPSHWIEYKRSFKRSESDVVSWLADEVLTMFSNGTSTNDDETAKRQKRIRIAKVKAMAKIKLLNLLN